MGAGWKAADDGVPADLLEAGGGVVFECLHLSLEVGRAAAAAAALKRNREREVQTCVRCRCPIRVSGTTKAFS